MPGIGLACPSGSNVTAAASAERFDLACDLARQCGRIAMAERRAGGFAVRSKGPQDFVTNVDFLIESTIRSRIARDFPSDAVLGEEGGRSRGASDVTWIIDPIDGTANYIHDLGHWSVSIAALVGDRLAFGVVYDPVREEMFMARAGAGATDGSGTRLCIADPADIGQALVGVGYCTSLPPQRHAASIANLIAAGASCRDLGSAALSLAYVAAGRLDAYVETGIMSWDIAAGILIVTEAGGRASPLERGERLAQPTMVIAAAPAIAETVARCVRSAWFEPDDADSPAPVWMSECP